MNKKKLAALGLAAVQLAAMTSTVAYAEGNDTDSGNNGDADNTNTDNKELTKITVTAKLRNEGSKLVISNKENLTMDNLTDAEKLDIISWLEADAVDSENKAVTLTQIADYTGEIVSVNNEKAVVRFVLTEEGKKKYQLANEPATVEVPLSIETAKYKINKPVLPEDANYEIKIRNSDVEIDYNEKYSVGDKFDVWVLTKPGYVIWDAPEYDGQEQSFGMNGDKNGHAWIGSYTVTESDVKNGDHIEIPLPTVTAVPCAGIFVQNNLNGASYELRTKNEKKPNKLISGNAEVVSGETIELKITPERGKKFSTDPVVIFGGQDVSVTKSGNQYTCSITVVDNLEPGSEFLLTFAGETVTDETYNPDVSVKLTNNIGNTTITGINNGEKVAAGDSVRVVVTPDEYYFCSNPPIISVNGTEYTMERFGFREYAYTFDVPTVDKELNIIIKGEAVPENGYFKWEVNNADMGEIKITKNNDKNIAIGIIGDVFTLEAIPKAGYLFDRWDVRFTDGRSLGAIDNARSKTAKFTVTQPGSANYIIKAYFRSETSSPSSSGGSTSSGNSAGSYYTPSEIGSTVSPAVSNTEVKNLVSGGSKGSTVTVANNTELSGDTVKAAADKGVAIDVKATDAITINVDTSKLSDAAKNGGIKVYAKSETVAQTDVDKFIPVTDADAKSAVKETIGFSADLKNADSAASVTLTCAAKSTDDEPQFANLYKKNSKGELEFAGVVSVDKYGRAKLPLSGSGSYTVVVSAESKLIGDLDNSCGINALDAVAVLKMVAASVNPNGGFKFDYNGDGKKNVLDAVAILKDVANGKFSA